MIATGSMGTCNFASSHPVGFHNLQSDDEEQLHRASMPHMKKHTFASPHSRMNPAMSLPLPKEANFRQVPEFNPYGTGGTSDNAFTNGAMAEQRVGLGADLSQIGPADDQSQAN